MFEVKNSPYILQELYDDQSCSSFHSAYGYHASGNCEGSRNIESVGNTYIKATLGTGGESWIRYYNDSQCQDENEIEDLKETVSSLALLDHSCQEYNSINMEIVYYKWYSSMDSSGPGPSGTSGPGPSPGPSGSGDGHDNTGSSTGVIVGVICGVIIFVLLGVGSLIIYRRRSQDKSSSTLPTIPIDLESVIKGQPGLWNDDVITAKRIPRDKVKVKKLLSRGAYGEVYKGVYNRQEVAVKVLLPSTRGNLQHVNDFLAEAKLTATMDHPHIVTFIGVAWDSLSDVCVVLEFMDGGDLRTLLNSYEATKRPVGFNKQKATIALHVCEALTYLHSLMPPVIHRDLKSRNILLNRNLEAKLTDFGVSKERLDQPMTIGVGTSLWMAPEVMMGDKYDVKADIFSLGVMLSELDVHTLPYTQVKERSLAATGRKMADATLFQKVTAGEVQVEFSDSIPRSLLELGLACVSVDPLHRPTAAEAQYRLQASLTGELA
ncbi:hypothetical protein DVH05_004628 [Phytophthora capsici]|nr:hypothetical protein DVH05_004628 [Phytophthora capsici]